MNVLRAFLAFFGWHICDLPQSTQGFTYTVEDVPMRKPTFERKYKVKIHGGFVVECSIEDRSYRGGRDVSGYAHLIEPSGRSILFNHERIAEDIIIPELIQPTKDALQLILSLDREWVRSKPNSFKDENGVTWVKQP